MRRLKQTCNKGSALLQTAFIVIATGAVLLVALSALEPLNGSQTYKTLHKTDEGMVRVQQAISNYVERYGALPCPAPMLEGSSASSSRYGRSTDCTAPAAGQDTISVDGRDGRKVRIGTLPGRTLDLAMEDQADAYGQQYIYAVTEDLTDSAKFNNKEGAISVIDAEGNELTREKGFVEETEDPDPGMGGYGSGKRKGRGKGTGSGTTISRGSALYVLLSRGRPDDTDNQCDTKRGDGENCDNKDATFKLAGISLSGSSTFFDDRLVYSEMEPHNTNSLCGAKGKVYAPSHPESDADDCLDVTNYEDHQSFNVTTSADIPCNSSDNFCESGWINTINLPPGNYFLNWNAFLQFRFPQPSQYAMLEFEAGSEHAESLVMPFTNPVCSLPTQIQNENGFVALNVKQSGILRVRLKYYGGQNSPGTNGCGGAVPTLSLVTAGQGDESAKASLSVIALRRFGGGAVSSIYAKPSKVKNDIVATLTEAQGIVTVAHDDGTSESVKSLALIRTGDKIRTDATGGATIVFLDNTMIMLSEDTEFDVNDYLYDALSGKGNADYHLVHGVFMYLSGLMREDDTKITTPVASIGIRGTKIFGSHDPSTNTSLIQLIEGDIVVTGLDPGKGEEKGTVELKKPYEMGEIDPASPTVRSMPQDDEKMCRIYHHVHSVRGRAHLVLWSHAKGKVKPGSFPLKYCK